MRTVSIVTGGWLSAAGYGCPQVTFTGCTTDANFQHGFFIDATTGTATINVVGCNFHRDGNNTSGTWAGLAISQTAAGNLHMQVIARGVMVTATTAAHGVGPNYGLLLNGTGVNLDIDGARLIGNTGAVSLTGVPARLQVGPGMSYATGDSSSPTTVAPANWKSGTAVQNGTTGSDGHQLVGDSELQDLPRYADGRRHPRRGLRVCDYRRDLVRHQEHVRHRFKHRGISDQRTWLNARETTHVC